MMKIICTIILCTLIIGCTSKPKQKKEVPLPAENNAVGINDTLGISLHPEYPVYSVQQKNITFVLANNSFDTIFFGESYSYTYEDEQGIWRDVPIQLVVFDVEYGLFQGNKFYYHAELFKHTPGRYRFFVEVRRDSKEYTLMSEFQLK